MAKISRQASADGEMVDDLDPAHPSLAHREDALRQGFTARGWTVDAMASDDSRRSTRLEVSRGTHRYTLNIFIFANLAYASRHEEEKRIQLTRDYAEHSREFELPKSGSERCLLLGMYYRDEQTIFAAWDAYAYRDHKNPSSCYVRVPALADAMRTGFGQSVDGKGRLVCCFQPDLLPYYVENMHDLHERVVVNDQSLARSSDEEPVQNTASTIDNITGAPNAVPEEIARNRILYGAPGTGKSHRLDTEVSTYFKDAPFFERVTFHPDYTYGQFVGSYRPVPIYRQASENLVASDRTSDAGRYEPLIDYVFVPGPFLRLLTLALKHPAYNFALVIEELNRANAPAVFGEVFQLLDRNNDGEGNFSVSLPSEAQDYLRAQSLPAQLRLPKNLYLWATMNSADQGVMPLDAAFKRRWSFEYVPLNAQETTTKDWQIQLNFLPQPMLWNVFRKAINDHLRKHDIPEDRLLGPFFMRQNELASPQGFKNKLLLYLRDDVVRHNPEVLFKGTSLGYGTLVEAYDEGREIFVDGVNLGYARQNT